MTQNACPANAKVSKGSSPYSHPSALPPSSGPDQMNVMGGSLDLLEDLSEVLMEPGGIRMGPTEGMRSATPKLWHCNSHETSRSGPAFFFFAGLGPSDLWEL